MKFTVQKGKVFESDEIVATMSGDELIELSFLFGETLKDENGNDVSPDAFDDAYSAVMFLPSLFKIRDEAERALREVPRDAR